MAERNTNKKTETNYSTWIKSLLEMLGTSYNQRFAREHHKYRSGQNKLLGLERNKEHNEHKRQAICLPKFTSTKKATSPLRFPQREGYHEEPLASPNPPQR
jgi:hypothetical protein